MCVYIYIIHNTYYTTWYFFNTIAIIADKPINIAYATNKNNFGPPKK